MTQMTVQQALELGIRQQQSGQLAEAGEIYRQILEQRPNHPDALRFLGVIEYQSGRAEPALELLHSAISANPRSAECYDNLGHVLASIGRLEESAEAFQKAVELDRNSADAYTNLGTVLLALNRLQQAVDVYRVALTIHPSSPEILSNLGIALVRQGANEDAIPYLQQAVALRKDFPQAYCNLGIALKNVGQFSEAIESFRCALDLKPKYAEASLDLADALRQTGRVEEAIALARQMIDLHDQNPEIINSAGGVLQACNQFRDALEIYQKAVALHPEFAEGHYNIGTCLRELQDDEGAVAAFRRALNIHPDLIQAHNNLGSALTDLGQYEQAIASLRNALALSPDMPSAHFNLGIALLTQGDLSRGFEEIEWRWQTRELSLSARQFPQRRWHGEELNGRRILLHAEQGFGDTIQFIRYLPLVARRGGKIILGCQKELMSLLKQYDQVEQFITQGEALPPFDVHCALLSLPLVFKTDLQSIPASVGYLKADANLTEKWQQRIGEKQGLKVGLCWSGRSTHKRDRSRSIRFDLLSPIMRMEGIQCYSLQKGESNEVLIDWTNELDDFAQTAALIQNLDLIITVDTAIAHLAGALGKPVWVLLPLVPDWRWLLEREDSPWYPTMRLFRQTKMNDWSDVIERVKESLRTME